MINQRQKNEMRDYLVARLEVSGLKAQPRRKEILRGSGLETGYILVGNNEGVILLVDGVYPRESFQRVYEGVQTQISDTAAVVFKDGKTFFRTAVGDEEITGIQSKRFKQDFGLSLKNYTNEQLRKMISFRPEEEFLQNRKHGRVQYYQPASERLEQGIITYNFEPVVFDYSHLPAGAGFGLVQNESKKLRIWEQREPQEGVYNGPLRLYEGNLSQGEVAEGGH